MMQAPKVSEGPFLFNEQAGDFEIAVVERAIVDRRGPATESRNQSPAAAES